MRNALLAIAILLLLPASAAAQPTVPAATVPAPTPEGEVFLPLILKTACRTSKATLALSGPRIATVGEPFLVTLTLRNLGCADIGQPRYSLRVEPLGAPSLFDHLPEPETHNLGLGTGDEDRLVLELTASRAGSVALMGVVSYEIHYGYPGPAAWGGAVSEPLSITVEP